MQTNSRRSGNELYLSMVIFIGSNKRLKDYYTPKAQYIRNDDFRVEGSDAARCIDPFVFGFDST
jgi:hypothetical protein